MTFYDLNVQWAPNALPEMARTLYFLAELGYTVVALNHTVTGKLPAELTCAIPNPLPFTTPPSLTVLRRLTLVLTEAHSNARLACLSQRYDLVALRPLDERTLQNCASNLDSDLISLDLSVRQPYHFKFKTLSEAIKRGIRFEICYAPGVADKNARQQSISNATQLIRASRGPWDVVNLATIWGLSQERGYEAISKECRSVVVSARLKRTGYRGVVDIVDAGEDAPTTQQKPNEGQHAHTTGKKRKAEVIASPAGEDKPVSKREQKRRAKAARLAGSGESTPLTSSGA
ncbi:RNA-binding RNA processing protein rpp1 [Taxawa tesnikishii (nom. ined.)]|nr:RNA-binding RNA processing protein rpp1 [Dothideales sp. JES 119]